MTMIKGPKNMLLEIVAAHQFPEQQAPRASIVDEDGV